MTAAPRTVDLPQGVVATVTGAVRGLNALVVAGAAVNLARRAKT